ILMASSSRELLDCSLKSPILTFQWQQTCMLTSHVILMENILCIYEHILTNIDVRLYFNYLLKHLKFAEYAGLLQRGYFFVSSSSSLRHHKPRTNITFFSFNIFFKIQFNLK